MFCLLRTRFKTASRIVQSSSSLSAELNRKPSCSIVMQAGAEQVAAGSTSAASEFGSVFIVFWFGFRCLLTGVLLQDCYSPLACLSRAPSPSGSRSVWDRVTLELTLAPVGAILRKLLIQQPAPSCRPKSRTRRSRRQFAVFSVTGRGL